MARLGNRVFSIFKMDKFNPRLRLLRCRIARGHRYRKPSIKRRYGDGPARIAKAENQEPAQKSKSE
jgi:hypothetical protein